jgi:serine phosphatase RsbU (regulator of sigma subunit)
MGIAPGTQFPAATSSVPRDARLYIFSDGVFEIRRDKCAAWNLPDCIAYIAGLGQREESVMDPVLARARDLRGSPQLDDDFSIIEARLR